MAELYRQMKDKPYAADLGELWQRLGAETAPDGVQFRHDATLAEARTAITPAQ